MGMGFGSNFADVIEFEDVKALCPKETDALEATLQKYGVAMTSFARAFRWDEPELEDLQTAISDAAPETLQNLDSYETQAVQEITEAFQSLQTAFAKATAVGRSHLDLFVGYHDPDDGDRYDEVDGVFWAVDGMFQLSPAGKKFGSKVERKFFVTFG